jgi:hypothetical protein
MSVFGEFKRLTGGCIDFLEDSGAEAAQPWLTALYAVRAIAADDLSEAAARVLALGEGFPSIEKVEFPTASECEEFRELSGRMLAIARVIVGAPESASPHG